MVGEQHVVAMQKKPEQVEESILALFFPDEQTSLIFFVASPCHLASATLRPGQRTISRGCTWSGPSRCAITDLCAYGPVLASTAMFQFRHIIKLCLFNRFASHPHARCRPWKDMRMWISGVRLERFALLFSRGRLLKKLCSTCSMGHPGQRKDWQVATDLRWGVPNVSRDWSV